MNRRGERILLGVGVLMLLAFSLAPFVYMVVVSLSERPEVLGDDVPWRLTGDYYREVLTDESRHLLDYLRNSVVISFAAAAGAVAVAAMAAYAITRLRMPGKIILLLGVLAVSMFPQVGLVGYLVKLINALGWFNTWWGLIFPYMAWVLPLSLWILVSYFAQIPRDLDEAALVDGCSHWGALVRVLLPVAAPGVFSVFLLAFILAFNEFLFALLLTSDHRAQTIPVGIAHFIGKHGQTPWGSIMAASVVTVVPVVILTLLFQRRIIGGLTQGAVKG
ncbi:MAG: carbohydrate ABC transporter permease [Planctomycetota bacterium]